MATQLAPADARLIAVLQEEMHQRELQLLLEIQQESFAEWGMQDPWQPFGAFFAVWN